MILWDQVLASWLAGEKSTLAGTRTRSLTIRWKMLLYATHTLLFKLLALLSIYPLVGVYVSNKVSHDYSAGVGPSDQIFLKRKLNNQVKPFF